MNDAESEQRLRLLDLHYGLLKAAATVDASADNVKALFKERRLLIQDRIDIIGNHLEHRSPELFDPESTLPEVQLLIANPLADLPRP